MSLLGWLPDLLSLVTSLGPIAHVGGLAAGFAFPPLGILMGGKWKWIALGVGALLVLLIVGGLYVRIQHLDAELAEERAARAEERSQIAAAEALRAQKIAEENAAAVATLERRHASELQALSRQRDQARAAAAAANDTIKELAREPGAKDPLPRALEPLLRRLQ